jgi:hypothetical protein
VHLDDRARRIGPGSPQLGLHLVDDRAIAEHVSDVDDEADRVAQVGAFRLGDQLHVEKCLPDARLVALDERIGLGIDAAHACDVDEIAGTGAEAPGPGRPDGARGRQRLDAVRRELLPGSCAGKQAGANHRHCKSPHWFASLYGSSIQEG